MDKGKNSNRLVRISSKSRPGLSYLFNKNGDTKWRPLKQAVEATERKQDTPPKLSLNKVIKTPAQDRLKRLQHSLRECQTKPSTCNKKPKNVKEQENEFDAVPSTSSCLKDVTKRSHSASFPSVKDDLKEKKFKELPLPDSSLANTENTTDESFAVDAGKEDSHSSKQLANNILQNIEKSSSKITNIGSGIIKRITQLCRLPFNLSRKIADQKPHSKTDDSISLVNTLKFKATNKAKSKLTLSTSSQKEIIKQINEESKKSPNNQIFITSPLSNIRYKHQNIPSCSGNSANLRLERLKQSLLAEQQSSSAKYSSATSIAIEENNNRESKDHEITSNEFTNTADETRKDEDETMEWEPIMEEESQRDDDTTFKPTLVIEKSRKRPLKSVGDVDNFTKADIIDTVNENLLRISAEKQKDAIKNNGQWRKNFYYFVLDTNVLLKHLTFIEDLSKMKLCDTEGSLLYIPYSVLQELDRLKMRSGTQPGIKKLAVRAIKYLNTKLENSSLHVQAQSAVDESHHLINVDSADDSIINCCLQVKDHIPNLLLLTEDINLRNKAISSSIMVSTKSDLMTKRYDCSDVS